MVTETISLSCAEAKWPVTSLELAPRNEKARDRRARIGLRHLVVVAGWPPGRPHQDRNAGAARVVDSEAMSSRSSASTASKPPSRAARAMAGPRVFHPRNSLKAFVWPMASTKRGERRRSEARRPRGGRSRTRRRAIFGSRSRPASGSPPARGRQAGAAQLALALERKAMARADGEHRALTPAARRRHRWRGPGLRPEAKGETGDDDPHQDGSEDAELRAGELGEAGRVEEVAAEAGIVGGVGDGREAVLRFQTMLGAIIASVPPRISRPLRPSGTAAPGGRSARRGRGRAEIAARVFRHHGEADREAEGEGDEARLGRGRRSRAARARSAADQKRTAYVGGDEGGGEGDAGQGWRRRGRTRTRRAPIEEAACLEDQQRRDGIEQRRGGADAALAVAADRVMPAMIQAIIGGEKYEGGFERPRPVLRLVRAEIEPGGEDDIEAQ